jgi:hypothetical protein
MNFYSIALFLHIVGALGFFVAFGLEWTSWLYLRRATTITQAREWLGVLGLLRRVGPVSMGIILLAGFYLMATAWGGTAWIGIALAAMVLIAVLGGVLTGRRVAGIGQALAAESETLSLAFRQRLNDPLLETSLKVRVAIALGIVFLMTAKPALEGALLTLSAAVIVGLASTLPAWNRGQLKRPTT